MGHSKDIDCRLALGLLDGENNILRNLDIAFGSGEKATITLIVRYKNY